MTYDAPEFTFPVGPDGKGELFICMPQMIAQTTDGEEELVLRPSISPLKEMLFSVELLVCIKCNIVSAMVVSPTNQLDGSIKANRLFLN